MGRELRRVPPNWDHPKSERGEYRPLYDQTFAEAFLEWLDDFDRVRCGEMTDFERECYPSFGEWCADHHPPDPKYYVPYTSEQATWFQIFETVSEGTPVTPPFATKAELVEYLVRHGDFWQQKRWNEGNHFMQPNPPGYSRESAEAFVEQGWAPSMVISNGKLAMGIDVPLALKSE